MFGDPKMTTPDVHVQVGFHVEEQGLSPTASVVEMLMALYRSAELGRVVNLPWPELDTYIPVAAGAASQR